MKKLVLGILIIFYFFSEVNAQNPCSNNLIVNGNFENVSGTNGSDSFNNVANWLNLNNQNSGRSDLYIGSYGSHVTTTPTNHYAGFWNSNISTTYREGIQTTLSSPIIANTGTYGINFDYIRKNIGAGGGNQCREIAVYGIREGVPLATFNGTVLANINNLYTGNLQLLATIDLPTTASGSENFHHIQQLFDSATLPTGFNVGSIVITRPSTCISGGWYIYLDNFEICPPQVINPTGTISGFKFLDKNCNGKIDRDEQKLPNWTINLTGFGISRTSTTDANGNYTFQNLPLGTYTVAEVNQSGYTPSSPTNGRHENVILNTQNTNRINVNFGNCIDSKSCCKNKINIVSSEFITEAQPAATIGLEIFKVQVGSNPNIREVRANIESIEYLNPSIGCTGASSIPFPIFNGSIIDATSSIGNPALLTSYVPLLSLYSTNNQVIWSNQISSSLNVGSEIGLVYLLPGGANSCAKSARICIRFTFIDENCSVCEYRFCREISLIPSQKSSNNIKSKLKSKIALDLIEESKIIK